MTAKSAVLLASIEGGLDRIMQAWLLVAGLATALRIATSPVPGPIGMDGLMPYLLLILAPFASMVMALRWFADGDRQAVARPRITIGRWRDVGRAEATRHPLYGAGGIMVSLLVGMLLNVPVRALEYWASIPPVVGNVPAWMATLHFAMSLDVVLLTSLYVVAFVAALRRVPSFPRLLVMVWAIDLSMQLLVAEMVAAAPGMPANVAGAMQTLLDGNIKKVLISVAVWAPYLVFSKRVNVTYRLRVRG